MRPNSKCLAVHHGMTVKKSRTNSQIALGLAVSKGFAKFHQMAQPTIRGNTSPAMCEIFRIYVTFASKLPRRKPAHGKGTHTPWPWTCNEKLIRFRQAFLLTAGCAFRGHGRGSSGTQIFDDVYYLLG